MKSIQFRLAARTDAAGKFKPDAPLEGNEDNMFVDCLLNDEKKGAFMGDDVVELSKTGCLMVVADGMGGMNAGEVASDIAIKTVERYFAPGKITESICHNTKSRISYLEEVVVAADAAIKADSRNNPEHEGMGSTIILAWLLDGEICLTWCGDSRAYLFRPGVGLRQVSKDHSYVQGLVDEGKISIDQAFDHPYGNIVTRSLGDPDKKAKPESNHFKVYKDDIFLLCSDGLSGVLRDRKTYKDGRRIDTENIEDIISENRQSMVECRDALFDAAQRNEWYDNVTVVLCEIIRGETAPDGDVELQNEYLPNDSVGNGKKSRRLKYILMVASLLILVGGGFFVKDYCRLKNEQKDRDFFEQCYDVNGYRSYLRQFKNGQYKSQAELFIEQFVKDSIEFINKQRIENDLEKIDESGSDSKNLKSTLDPKDKNSQKGTTDKVTDSVPEVKGQLSLSSTLTPVPEPEKNNAPNELQEKQNNPVTALTADNEQEAMSEFNRDPNKEKCVEYLIRFGGQNYDHTKNTVDWLKGYFAKRIRKCKTLNELSEIELEFEQIVSRIPAEIQKGFKIDKYSMDAQIRDMKKKLG